MKELYRFINLINTSTIFFGGESKGRALVSKSVFSDRSSPVHHLLTLLSSFLLLQPLARLGAVVLGIDPVEDSIGMARLHSSYDPDVRGQVRYRACTLEELSAEEEEEGGDGEQGAGLFDAIVASEVVEHLADRETFALCSSCMLKVRVFPPAVPPRQMFLHPNTLSRRAFTRATANVTHGDFALARCVLRLLD